jgi:hypothetical protein
MKSDFQNAHEPAETTNFPSWTTSNPSKLRRSKLFFELCSFFPCPEVHNFRTHHWCSVPLQYHQNPLQVFQSVNTKQYSASWNDPLRTIHTFSIQNSALPLSISPFLILHYRLSRKPSAFPFTQTTFLQSVLQPFFSLFSVLPPPASALRLSITK